MWEQTPSKSSEHIPPNEEGGIHHTTQDNIWRHKSAGLQLSDWRTGKLKAEWLVFKHLGYGGIETVTHSDEREDVIHVGPDVDLNKAHHHSHLLEKELHHKR